MNQISVVKNTAFIALLAAVLCILAPLSVPTSAIPVSLASFAIYIIASCVKTKYSVIAVTVYILLGAFGLPVFSAFTGGFHRIAGITGGYIIGYIPCAFIIGLLINKYENKKFVFPLSMISGTVLCYFTGTLWYILQTKASVTAAIFSCVIPFIIGDIIKIAVASILSIPLRKRLKIFFIGKD